jgi:ADP-heptose:LPS heptosyltransferase
MGYGDDIMATGFAKGAKDRGTKIAFGDGQRIIWGPHSDEIFKNNPNVVRPDEPRNQSWTWIEYYKGNRIYNRLIDGKWVWNYKFNAMPGEIFFQDNEKVNIDSGFILIEPYVPRHKSVWPNKDWGFEKYNRVCRRLTDRGHRVIQFANGIKELDGAKIIKTKSFRHAMAIMAHAKLAILPEGGLHHAAAALGKPAVVIFGGFIPPQVTGYDMHTNLTGGVKACGSLTTCLHCREALNNITVEDVFHAAEQYL